MYTGPKRVPAIAVTAYHDRREELITEGFPALVERLRDPLTLCKVIRHTPQPKSGARRRRQPAI